MVGDRQGVTVAAIAELELALEVGAPQVVGIGACRQRRAVGAVAPDSGAVDQAVAVEHRMHGAPGRQAHVAGKLANEQFADFARAPMRLVLAREDDQPLHLVRQLVGIAHRPSDRADQRESPRSWSTVEAKTRSCVTETPSTASTPPAKWRKVLPMCPVRSVTYVSGRSKLSGHRRSLDIDARWRARMAERRRERVKRRPLAAHRRPALRGANGSGPKWPAR